MILEISGLTKRYPDFALEDVSFSLPEGSIMGFIGENGAGKTTTIKLILNLIRRDAGDIRAFGLDVREREQEIKARLGVVFDECSFHDTLRASDIGLILRRAYGARWDDRGFAEYLRRFELKPEKLIKEYSRGMKMKLSIAAALSHRPDLLLLDEATSGLDPVVRDEMLNVFQEFVQDEHKSILISSHITGDLEKICDYISFIRKGKIALNLPKDDLIDRYGVVRCDETQAVRLLRAALGARKHLFGCELLVADRVALKRAQPDLAIDRATLEDIMVLYGREL